MHGANELQMIWFVKTEIFNMENIRKFFEQKIRIRR